MQQALTAACSLDFETRGGNPVTDLVGKTLLTRYRVDAFLGRGGMAEVYRARDTKRSVYVALKVLNEDLAEDYVFLRRFAREAHTLELLQHPHIVRFFGFEESHSIAFLVMEYIDGVTLRRQLRLLERPLTLPEALAVLQPVCSALHYAHQMGIYHCDVKPANIFIERGGRVVLGDFGIAQLSESATVTFSTPGTPAYMAPEQCRGEELDGRTDIYGLGVTTYEMLTLDRPFKGETEDTTGSRGERVRWEQMNVLPPRPGSVNPEVSPAAETAILRALEKEPGRRQQEALAFYKEISEGGRVQPTAALPWIMERQPTTEPPVSTAEFGSVPSVTEERKIRVPLVVWGALGVVVLLVAILGVTLASRGKNDDVDDVAILIAQLTIDARTTTAVVTSRVTRTPTWTPESARTPSLAPTRTPRQTVTSAPIATPTRTRTPTPTRTATSTSTSTPTPTQTATNTPAPTPCTVAVYGAFSGIWQANIGRLGCPLSAGKSGVWMAEERFQYGRMFWKEDNDKIYVLYDNGHWERYDDIWHEGEAEFTCGTTSSPPTPKRGFGKIWCTYNNVRQGLGDATSGEWGDRGSVQAFNGGLTLQTAGGQVYIFFNDGTWR
jgi:serine/threonine protein kinase